MFRSPGITYLNFASYRRKVDFAYFILIFFNSSFVIRPTHICISSHISVFVPYLRRINHFLFAINIRDYHCDVFQKQVEYRMLYPIRL